jgi:hypothetical protein
MRMPRLRLSVILATSILFAACNDNGGGVGRLRGALKMDPAVNFGDVQVGILQEYDFTVKNIGNAVVQIKKTDFADGFSAMAYEFKVSPVTMVLQPSETKHFKVTFQPFMEMATPVSSMFTFRTDIPDSSMKGAQLSYPVTVSGRGVKSGLVIQPNPVDFGTVLFGSSKNVDVKITNALSVAVDVKTKMDASGKPDIMLTQGTGTFEIVSPVAQDGSLIQGGGKLDSMLSIVVTAKYTPDPAAPLGRIDQATWTVSNCDEALCAVPVGMTGKGTDSALDCNPAAIDFNAVNPGRTADRMVTCTNIASDAIILSGWGPGPMTAQEFQIAPYTGMPSMLMPNEQFTVAVRFAPSQDTLNSGRHPTGSVLIQGRFAAASRALAPVTIPLKGEAGGPTIAVLPTALEFGQVALMTHHSKKLLVSNSGYSDLNVTTIKADGPNAMLFTPSSTSFTLAVGTSTVVTVTFAPTMQGDFTSNLLIDSNDGSTPELVVNMHGVGVDLPPCSYSLMPTDVNFGIVNVQSPATKTVRVSNTGTNPCLLNDTGIDPAMSDYHLVNGAETGIMIAPGGSHDIPVQFAPTRAGASSAALTFYISDPTNPDVRVPLHGVGQANTQIICPPDMMTPAGTAVTLNLNIMTMGTTIQSINWAVTSAPMGGMGTPSQWTPDPPNAASEQFLPYLVGVYAIHATVIDNLNESFSCDVHVTAVGHGLRVELTWDGMGDVDLHLHNSTMSPWFSQSPGANDDCYYANRTPLWNGAQMPATGNNPQLDFDNTFANGPENTRIDVPVIGESYTIGVHNYRDSNGRIATIQVYCGGVLMPTQTFMSMPLLGSPGNAGQNNDGSFWRVATVTFTTNTNCTITPINTYTTGAGAYVGF